jgi:hypothetical protein
MENDSSYHMDERTILRTRVHRRMTFFEVARACAYENTRKWTRGLNWRFPIPGSSAAATHCKMSRKRRRTEGTLWLIYKLIWDAYVGGVELKWARYSGHISWVAVGEWRMCICQSHYLSPHHVCSHSNWVWVNQVHRSSYGQWYWTCTSNIGLLRRRVSTAGVGYRFWWMLKITIIVYSMAIIVYWKGCSMSGMCGIL